MTHRTQHRQQHIQKEHCERLYVEIFKVLAAKMVPNIPRGISGAKIG
jgi:hypothetical protein